MVLGVVGVPVVVLAVLGVVAIGSDEQLRSVGREMGALVVYEGQRLAYAALTVGCCAVVGGGVWVWRDAWWKRNGEEAANRLLRHRIDQVRWERDRVVRELEEAREEVERCGVVLRAAFEEVSGLQRGAGRVQMLLAGVEKRAEVRQVGDERAVVREGERSEGERRAGTGTSGISGGDGHLERGVE